MATTSGGDVVVVTIDRTCAKQLLLALTLALGGTPIKQLSYGKGKGKGKTKSSSSASAAAVTKGKASQSRGKSKKSTR